MMIGTRQGDGLLRTAFFSILVAFTFIAFTGSDKLAAQDSGPVSAREILRRTGVQGGLIVHVGCGDGTLTAAFHKNEKYVVQGLAAANRKLYLATEDGKVTCYWSGLDQRCSGDAGPAPFQAVGPDEELP